MPVRNSIRRLIVCGSFAAVAGVAAAQPSGVIGYDVIEIRPLEGHSSTSAEAMDDFGRFLILSNTTPGTYFVWINGDTLVVPPVPGFDRFGCADIGAGGVVVGYAIPSQGLAWRAVAWTVSQGIHLLPPIPGTDSSEAHAVDDRPWPHCRSTGISGAVVTYSTVWQGEQPIRVGAERSWADAINNLGHVVGTERNQLGVTRPTLWRDGQSIDVGGEPFDQGGSATAVNDWTEVVGSIQLFGAFHWSNGVRRSLPRIGTCGASPWAINNLGVVAGESNPDPRCINGQQHAVIWERVNSEFTVHDLNDWIPRYSDLRLVSAKDINDAGQMAVVGEYDDGRQRALLVTPYRFELSNPVPGRAGRKNTVTITGLQPDQRVVLVWGTQEGAQKIRPTCPGGTLLIRDPHALPMVRADENGVATFTTFIPPYARGRTIRMQAIAPFECEISHTVTWTFE
ncbi:MAG: hypothetical protein IT430_00990 [Phycisphaerales bacterium]|nr:hypothetical protein [Phycisphaerales bacterium]